MALFNNYLTTVVMLSELAFKRKSVVSCTGISTQKGGFLYVQTVQPAPSAKDDVIHNLPTTVVILAVESDMGPANLEKYAAGI